MKWQEMYADERSPQELCLIFTIGKLAALIHLFTNYPGVLREDVLRGAMQRMHDDVYGLDFSEAGRPDKEGLMKGSLADCEELLEHALGIQPQGFEKPLYQFMPTRYYVGTPDDTDLVIMHGLVIQCLFLFVAQAIGLMRDQGQLFHRDVVDLREWAICMLQEMQIREVDLAQRGNILVNAITFLRANLGYPKLAASPSNGTSITNGWTMSHQALLSGSSPAPCLKFITISLDPSLKFSGG